MFKAFLVEEFWDDSVLISPLFFTECQFTRIQAWCKWLTFFLFFLLFQLFSLAVSGPQIVVVCDSKNCYH